LAVEHAYDQRAAIKEVFADSPFAFVRELDDYGGNARVLIFELRELNPFG
jgi:methylase of polypeptide subunit release factors